MLIFGHRGAAGLAPENTLLSFQKALALGVDAIEFDIRLCGGDNKRELVVFHDETLERCTNGHGCLEDISFGELRQLDAGEEQQVPTLQEVCELIFQQDPNHKTLINIELKGKQTAQPVMDYLLSQSFKIPYEQILISSFHFEELVKIRKILGTIKIGVLVKKDYAKAFTFAKEVNAYSVHPHLETVERGHIEQAAEQGLKSFVFTVNREEDFARLKDWKVDGVFTDFPDRINS